MAQQKDGHDGQEILGHGRSGRWYGREGKL